MGAVGVDDMPPLKLSDRTFAMIYILVSVAVFACIIGVMLFLGR